MLLKVENEIKNFSGWFRGLFYFLFAIYLSAWLFTIHLSNIQIARGLQPVLPVATMDSTEYRNLSQSMLSGQGFSQYGYVNTLQSPGYPFFVSVIKYFTRSYFGVTLIQILLVFLSAALIRKMGLFYFSKNSGEVSAALFLLNPVVFALSLDLMTDVLFLFLFTLGLFMSLKSRPLVTSIIFAAAIYVRPMGIFALPIFAAPIFARDEFWKNKLLDIAKMAFIILVAVSPWVYRNYKLTGVADFSSFRSANLGLYAAPMFLSNQNHTDIEIEKKNLEKEIGVPISRWRDLEFSKQVSDGAIKIILNNPFGYIKFHLVSSVSFLFASSIQYLLEVYRQAMHLPNELEPGAIKYLISHDWKLFLNSIIMVWWKVLERLGWLFVYLLSAVGVWKERRKKVVWVFVFIPLYLMFLAGPLGNARYAVQSLSFKLLLFGVGFQWLISKVRKQNVQK